MTSHAGRFFLWLSSNADVSAAFATAGFAGAFLSAAIGLLVTALGSGALAVTGALVASGLVTAPMTSILPLATRMNQKVPLGA